MGIVSFESENFDYAPILEIWRNSRAVTLMDSQIPVHGDSYLEFIHRVSLVDRYLWSRRVANSLNFIV